MENNLFKDVVKTALILVLPLLVLSLFFFDGQIGIAFAIAIGALLGIFRVKAFFSHITCSLNHEKSSIAAMAFIKYLANWLLTIGLIGFALVKSAAIGLAMLLGLITVPIAVAVYAMVKGISLYRKK